MKVAITASMKRLIMGLVALSFGSIPSFGAENEIRGSIFIPTLGGTLNFKVGLARVYLLTQKQVQEMLTRNEAALNALMEESKRMHAQAEADKINKYNSLVDDIERRRSAKEEAISKMEEQIALLRGDTSGAGVSEIDKLIDRRNAEVAEYEKLRQEAEQLGSKKPTRSDWKQPPIEQAVDLMFQPPNGVDYKTRSDAEGSFVIEVREKESDYLLILTKEKNAKLKWFLKLSLLKKDGDKYLFTDENSIWGADSAQVVELYQGPEGYSSKRKK